MARASASKQPSARANNQAALERVAIQAASEVPFVREFHRYLHVEHNASRHTLDAYRGDLKQFFEFLAHSSGAQASLAPLPKSSPLGGDGGVKRPANRRRHGVQNTVSQTFSAQKRATSG
jgi:hypothetical protein